MDQVVVQFKAEIDKLLADLKKVKAEVGGLNKEVKSIDKATFTNATGNVGKLNTSLAGLKSTALSVGAPLAAAFAIQQVVQQAIVKVNQFEEALDQLSSLTGLSQVSEDFNILKQGAIDLGREGSKGATEIINAFKFIGSARPDLLANAEALKRVTENAITLSEAGTIPLEESAIALTSSMNQFNLTAEDTEKIINTLASGSQLGAAGIGELAQTIDKSGTAAAANNVSFEQLVGLTETLADKNIKGAEAGTQLRNVILKLASDGKGFVDGQFNINAALEQTRAELLAIEDPAKRQLELTKRFGLESATAGQILISNIDTIKRYTDGVTGTNTAFEQAAINVDNVNGSVERLQATWESFIQTLGGSGDGAFGQVIQFIIEILNATIQDAIDYVNLLGSSFGKIKDALSPIIAELSKLLESLGLVNDASLSQKEAADALTQSFLVISKIIESFTGVLVFLIDIAAGIVNEFKEIGNELVGVKDAFQGLIDLIKTGLEPVIKLFDNLKERFSELNVNIDASTILFAAFGQAVNIIEFALKGVSLAIETFTRFLELISGVAKKAYDNLSLTKEAIILIGDTAKAALSPVIGLGSAIASLFSEEEKLTSAKAGKNDNLRKENELIEENTKKTNENKDAITNSLGAYDSLTKKVSDLNKQLLDQAVIGDINTDTLKKYEASLNELNKANEEFAFALESITEPKRLERLPIAIEETGQLVLELNEGFETVSSEGAKSFLDKVNEINDFINSQLVQGMINAASSIYSSIQQIQANNTETQLRNLESINQRELEVLQNRFDQGLINERQYGEQKLKIEQEIQGKRNKLLLKQAQREKDLAYTQAIINGAAAVVNSFKIDPTGILAIATGLAVGFEVAAIKNTPLPQFAKGTKDAPGGMAVVGERGRETMFVPQGSKIIPNNPTIKYNKELDAMVDGTFDAYIYKNWVLPQISQVLENNKKSKQKDFAESFANNLSVKASLNETNLLNSEKETRKILTGIYNKLGSNSINPRNV
jgi:TP901 family phage tail tape measure protein